MTQSLVARCAVEQAGGKNVSYNVMARDGLVPAKPNKLRCEGGRVGD